MEGKKTGWRRALEIAQTLGAGAGFVALQGVLSGTLTKVGQKAGEKIEQKIEEALGLDIAGAEKTTDDESLFEKAIVDGKLSPTEKKAVWDYLRSLRKTNPMLAKEWVRWIHNTMVKFSRDVTSAPKQARSKKKGAEEEEETKKESVTQEKKQSYKDYSDGIRIAENLLREIAAALDDTEREALLAQRNICIKEIKPHPTVVKAKDFAKDKVKEVVDGEKGNRENFNQTMSGWRDRAKAWREKR